MEEVKDKSFIKTALKHHSTVQEAIKVLQEQLTSLNLIRQSTKQSFILDQEKDLEKSTNDLLFSTSNFLQESPDNNKLSNSPVLSSTLKKQDKFKGDDVIRNLLPSFQQLSSDVEKLKGEHKEDSLTKLTEHNVSHLSAITPITKDSLASTTIPLSAASNSFNASDASLRNMQSPPGKPLNVLLPTTKKRNLTEILARLAYSSILSGTEEQESNASDELIGLLDKISQTGLELQQELKDAKSREAKLLQEVQRLQSKVNGYSPKQNGFIRQELDLSTLDMMTKCQRLEDALLSLQNENLKLNRQLKESITSKTPQHSESNLKRDMEEKFVETIKENANLLEKVDKMSKEVNFYEKKFKEKTDQETQLSVSDLNKTSTLANSDKSETEMKLEKRVQCLEKELNSALGDASESKNLQLRINELHRSLLDKDNQILSHENNLKAIRDKNKELALKCEDLQKKDVYKRREVMLLCDKFEKLKLKHKKLESEMLHLQTEGQLQNTKKWALEDSLQKVCKENEALHNKMLAEQRQLTMSKLLLEKDYDHLKKKYDSLLVKIAKPHQSEKTAPFESYSFDQNLLHKIGARMDLRLKSATFNKSQGETPEKHVLNSVEASNEEKSLGKILWAPPIEEIGKNRFHAADLYETSLRALRKEMNHKRRHTTHGTFDNKEPVNKSFEPNGLRVRSDTDVHYSVHSDDSALDTTSRNFPENNKEELNVRSTLSSTSLTSIPLQSRIIKHTDEFSTTPVNQRIPYFNKSNDRNNLPGKNPTTIQTEGQSKSVILSPQNDQHRSKSSYHQEYLNNLKGIERIFSAYRHSDFTSKIPPRKSVNPSVNQKPKQNPSNLRSKSESQSSSNRHHQHRRVHTAPNITLSQMKDKFFLTKDGVRYGDSPFSKEYLSNMEGIRLLANLSGSSDGNASKIPQRKSFSSIKSILKTSPISSAGSPSKLANTDEHKSRAHSPKSWNISPLALDQVKESYFSENDAGKFTNVQHESSPSSKVSDGSFHLSDLPCDQMNIYDKFRNFDSQLSDYKKPPVTVERKANVTVLQDTKRHAGQETTILTSAKKEEVLVRRHCQPQPRRVATVGSQPDEDSADQSSSSTTRDHAGRIEFLREIQINTGVRMPALMRDVTLRNDVLVNDSDLSGGVRFGLSGNQEAYANRLVKKYIKIAKKTSPEKK